MTDLLNQTLGLVFCLSKLLLPIPVNIAVATHNLDEIILQATTPNTLPDSRNILVVQETNFPGWEAGEESAA